MTEAEEHAARVDRNQYFLELSLVALTAVEILQSERTPEATESLRLLKDQYSKEQLAEGAMLVLNASVAYDADTTGTPVAEQVGRLREIMREMFAD